MVGGERGGAASANEQKQNVTSATKNCINVCEDVINMTATLYKTNWRG